jgi:predicted membrane channel-forming protein YqfA (hemolysin III family)
VTEDPHGTVTDEDTGVVLLGWLLLFLSCGAGVMVVNADAVDGERFNWTLFSFYAAAGIVALAVCLSANAIVQAIKRSRPRS